MSLSRYLDKNLYEQKIICTQADGTIPAEIAAEGVELIVVGKLKHTFHWQTYRKVLEVVSTYRPHIIHGAVFEGLSMATVGGFLGRVPVIVAEETSDPINRSRKAHILLKLLTTVADRVVAVSPATARYLEKTAKINPKKIQLINNGVEIPRPAKKAELDRLRRSHGIREDDLVVGSVGRI